MNLKELSYIKFLIKRHFECVDSKSNFQPSECEEMCVFHLPTFCLTLNNCIEHYQALLTLLRLVMSKWSQVQYVKGATRIKKIWENTCKRSICTKTQEYETLFSQLHRIFAITKVKPYPTILTIPWSKTYCLRHTFHYLTLLAF